MKGSGVRVPASALCSRGFSTPGALTRTAPESACSAPLATNRPVRLSAFAGVLLSPIPSFVLKRSVWPRQRPSGGCAYGGGDDRVVITISRRRCGTPLLVRQAFLLTAIEKPGLQHTDEFLTVLEKLQLARRIHVLRRNKVQLRYPHPPRDPLPPPARRRPGDHVIPTVTRGARAPGRCVRAGAERPSR